MTAFIFLLTVARAGYPHASKDVLHVLALRELLQASGSQYRLTSLCYTNQFFIPKAVVSLSPLQCSWSPGKGTLLSSVPHYFFPLIWSIQSWFPKLSWDRQAREGTLRRPQHSRLLDEWFWLSHTCSLPLSQWGGQGTNGFCHNRCVIQHQEGQKEPLCIAIREATEGTWTEPEMLGKKKRRVMLQDT